MTNHGARDDEREAVIQALNTTGVYPDQVKRIADRVLTATAPYRKHPEPGITHEMVARAHTAWRAKELQDEASDRDLIVAALGAALRVPVGEGVGP